MLIILQCNKKYKLSLSAVTQITCLVNMRQIVNTLDIVPLMLK
jgi:hypothetical protein